MNATTTRRMAVLGSILAGLALSAPVQAGHRQGATESGLTYVSPAFSNAIFGYRNLEGAERRVGEPRLIYVNPAFGQAIHGYPRVGRDSSGGLEVFYVSPAWGQAIYSYPGLAEPAGLVEVLPATAD